MKHAASNSDITDTPTKKLKSQSLPRETDSKQMFAFSSNITTKSEIIRTPQKTTIYVNKNISKSHDFDKPVSTTNIIVSGTHSTVTSSQKKTSEDSSLIKKFWSRSVKKQKDDEIDVMEAEDEQEECVSECMEHKSILQINTSSDTTTDIHIKAQRPKSGPAARQRVVPQEIEEPIKERASIFVGQKPVVEVVVKPQTTGTKPIPIARTHIGTSPARVFVHKSQEDLLSKSFEKEIKAHSISPPKTSWQEQHQLKTPKICGLSALQQKISNMESESPSKKPNVPKSNSFRVYTSSSMTSDSNLEKHNLPSLPNLSKIKDDEELLTINSEEPLKFSSLTEHYTEKKRVSQEKLTEIGKQKFEINDYNLVKHKKESGVEIVGVLKKKNIVLKGAEELSSNTSNNISQIEENIDKLMKSSVVTMLKNASFEDDDIKMEVIESSSDGSLTPESTKSPSKEGSTSPCSSKKSETKETEVVFREKRVSSVLEQFEAKMSPEIKAKPPLNKATKNEATSEETSKVELRETKPPKPPTTFRISPKASPVPDVTNETPSSPVKTHNATFQETEPRRSIIGDNDDRKVILQRRTSVSEERLKFERRISGGPSDDLKNERKKSQSDEELDVKPKDTHLGTQNNKKSANTSDDEEAPIVTMRKKSNEKIFGETVKNDETPELMKVFARRSQKIQLDDDENVQVQEIKKLIAAHNVDSDKENQSSSEEKLDKITQNNNNNQSTNGTTTVTTNNNTVPTSNKPTNATSSVISTNGGIKENNENVIPIDAKTNLVTPKPFGTPSRFSNVSNYRNSTTFIEARNKSLQSKSLSTNNNGVTTTTNVTNNMTSTTKTLTQDVKNNNSNNIRHTIGAIVNENVSQKIDTSEPEEIEFKGILQRRAEWEKRAKEGFK